MTAKDLLTEIYISDEIEEVIRRLEPADLQDDIKQHVFVELLQMEESFIVDLHTRGKLRHWVVKMLYNTSRWRNRSKFKKQYGFLEVSVEDFNDTKVSAEASNGINTLIKHSIDTGEQNEKETAAEIVVALSKVYWYKAEIFKLYIRLGTYQKVSDATGINISSIFQTVKQTKLEIKKYIQ